MRNLALRYKLMLPPAAAMLLLFGLAVTVAFYLRAINNQNDGVHQWVHALERMHIALASGQRLEALTREAVAGSRSREDIQFEYFEQFGIFEQHITHPYLVERLPADMQQAVLAAVPKLRDLDLGNAARTLASWQALLPRLETQYQAFWVQRRVSYVEFFNVVSRRISLLLMLVLGVVVLGFAASWAITRWVANDITKRIAALAHECADEGLRECATASRGDELDELTHCIARLRARLTHSINASRVLEGNEDERRRIAMDLHDQALSDLTHLARDLKMLESNPAQANAKRFNTLSGELEETIEDIRRIMDDLHPQTLDALGLEAALRSYLKRKLSRFGGPALQCHFDIGVDRCLSVFQRLMLYRVTLEALNNVIRHAHCNRCELDCRITENTLVLSVEDNGAGFDASAKHNGGCGLANISRRAGAIGASISWQASRFSSGTRFELRLPLGEPAALASGHEAAA